MAYEYFGDVNIEYGGKYLDFSEFEKWKDFIPCVKITDLDGGIGFDGAIMIERGSIYIPDDATKRKAALECCGWENEKEITPFMLADAFDAYSGVEQDSMDGMITIQTDKNGPMEFDGWKADEDATEKFHKSGLSLKEFIEANYL